MFDSAYLNNYVAEGCCSLASRVASARARECRKKKEARGRRDGERGNHAAVSTERDQQE